MKKLFQAVLGPCFACVLSIGCFYVCAQAFHLPPSAIWLATTVTVSVAGLAVLFAGVRVLLSDRGQK
jgi:hypothetical protein